MPSDIKECSLYSFTVHGVKTKTTPKDITARAAAEAAQATANGKQDALTAAQLAAVNSGITAEKVVDYDAFAKLTMTYTSNNYVTQNTFNRMSTYRVGPHMAVIHANFALDHAVGSSSWVTIGKISGVTLAYETYNIIPGQNAAGHTMIFVVTTDGRIQINSPSGASGEQFRATIPIVVNAFS